MPGNKTGIFNERIDAEIPSWRRRYLPACAPRYDLWHALHQDARHLPAKGTPFVLTVHDLNFLGEKSPPKAARRLQKVQKLVDRAQAMTVISRYTEGLVRKHLDVRDTPIEVIHNGLCTDPDGTAARPDWAPERTFLFTLGVVRPKKNFHVLIDMLTELDDCDLVIAGNTKGSYADEIRQRALRHGIADRVILPGEVDNRHKNWLFMHCEAFVFPSLYEGFGLPIVEAMSFGKPVFSSSLTSLPEVGGDDVYYWSHFEPAYMADVVRRGLRDFGADADRARRLRARSRQFSWTRAARRYAALYEKLW